MGRREGAGFCRPALHHTLQQVALRGSCGMGNTIHGGVAWEKVPGACLPHSQAAFSQKLYPCALSSQAMAYRGEIFQLDRLLIFHHVAQASCRQLGSEERLSQGLAFSKVRGPQTQPPSRVWKFQQLL